MQEKKPLSILVTAGGTQEDIDTVRSITNHATGRLGCLIAEAFLQSGARVTFLCGEASYLPTPQAHKVIKIHNVAQLVESLDGLLENNLYDCVIHSMAVSDFTPSGITTVDEMADAVLHELQADGTSDSLSNDEMTARIRRAILGASRQTAGKKISSKSPDLVLTLKQTPKVIGRIKAKQPHTLLVGFKLLSGVSEPELFKAGLGLIDLNGCDYVLANDLKDISGDAHKAFLMDKNGILRRADTKRGIAQMILECITERVGNK